MQEGLPYGADYHWKGTGLALLKKVHKTGMSILVTRCGLALARIMLPSEGGIAAGLRSMRILSSGLRDSLKTLV
jgi:hypothetical protein